MNNKILLISLVLIALFIFFGCGKNFDGGGSVTPNPTQLLITATFPSNNATDVSTNETIWIEFNNAINPDAFIWSGIIPSSHHAAGNPEYAITSPITYEFSSDKKRFTVRNIRGWSAIGTTNEAPIKVHLINQDAFEDIYGNKLATSESLFNYSLEVEWWRYWPQMNGYVTEYLISDNVLNPRTYEAWYTREYINPTIEGFSSNEAMSILQDGSVSYDQFNSFRSTNNAVEYTPFNVVPTPENRFDFARFPLFVGKTWDQQVALAPSIITFEVTSYQNHTTQLGTYKTYQVTLVMDNSPMNHLYYVYNIGLVKLEQYSGSALKVTYEAKAIHPF